MVRYLLNHRISVIMAFLAMVILGCVTFATLPVSLLPDIDMPHITVQVKEDNVSARELENTVVSPLRRQLMQVGHLDEIKSETRDGSAIISLTMDYGVDTGLALIEVNEKIDAAINLLPKGIGRPKAVKANAADIPIVYLQMTLNDENGRMSFGDMAGIADNIVRRRLEQLPQIAMADITGTPGNVLRITPDLKRMAEAGVSVEDLESAITANNVVPGSMTVRDGYYEYNITVTNLLRSAEDVQRIKVRKDDRIMDLGDFAEVRLTSRPPAGYSLHNGKRAVTLAIFKHGQESIAAANNAIDSTITYFTHRYPEIEFSKSRSQTDLLDFTISNLEQNLILGLVLVFIVCLIFMRSARLSFVIGLSIIVGVIITFLLFYLAHVSINIISLAGLILAVGMMIDNSVIVTENIDQFMQRGYGLTEACVKGTNEMITPMLSSSLTTVAVFVPLVFMSGIAGAIFYDQAFSITAGLAASYIVSITLLPVLYCLFENRHKRTDAVRHGTSALQKSFNGLYGHGTRFCFRYKWWFIAATLLTVPLCFVMFKLMRQERLPEIDSNETVARIDWNENLNLDANRLRVESLLDTCTVVNSAYIGLQDYLMSSDFDLSTSEAEIYLMTSRPEDIQSVQNRIVGHISDKYPSATVSFHKTDNIFERIFSSNTSVIF